MKTVKTAKSKTIKPAIKIAAKKVAAKKPSPKASNVKAATATVARTVSAKVKPAKTVAQPMAISRREIPSDLIATRAYIIWEQQGRPQGHDLANWLLAESQLKQEQSFTA